MAEERLQKILARAGIASRRAAEELITAGRVEVSGRIVRELGTKADPAKDLIRVDGRLVSQPEANVTYVLYKPERVVTTLSDPEGRACVGDLVRQLPQRVFPVGRLDYDAEGVLLLTSDGALAHKLTHPRWAVRRTYLAKVRGEPSPEALERMVRGVKLDDGPASALEAAFERATDRHTWIKIVVAEGRHRLVKRLCEAIGHPVLRLFRSDFGGIGVDGMKPGELRPLTPAERSRLLAAVAREAPRPPGGLPRRPRRAASERGGPGGTRTPPKGRPARGGRAAAGRDGTRGRPAGPGGRPAGRGERPARPGGRGRGRPKP